MRRSLLVTLGLGLAATALAASAQGSADATADAARSAASGRRAPAPGSPAYIARDQQNIADAYGRIDGPGGQLRNPAYLPALVQASTKKGVAQLLQQVATPGHLALTPGNVFPGWNTGNPFRAGWNHHRGLMTQVAFTNRYGALLRGHVYRPKPGARDPYTHRKLHGPFPGVVITEGSVQGSEGMYEWLAEDLAERGYVVLTYDVQGQGTSETLPHTTRSALPFCNPFAQPKDDEQFGCPGVPAQQESNFVIGTRTALSFFTSTPRHHYANPKAAGATVSRFNPYWRLFDRSPDRRTVTPGRTTRIAIIGHSLGASAVSKVQGVDRRVETVVALDKLASGDGTKPVVPALAIQSEYGFTVNPYTLSGGSSLAPQPSPNGPDPRRERRTGFDAWARKGLDTMLVVPRASTHLEYTDIPLVLPASRYGQDLTSAYVQRWLDRYLKHRGGVRPLLAHSMRYLEPVGHDRWRPVTLHRRQRLSFYYCSAYRLSSDHGLKRSGDIDRVAGGRRSGQCHQPPAG